MTSDRRDADPDPYSVTREIALKALDRRAYARAELGDYLARKGAAVDVIGRVLDRFEEVGLIEDGAFASQWVESRHRVRRLPRRALVAELRRKGLEEDVINRAVSVVDQEAEARAARDLAEAKAGSVAGLPPDTALRRLVGMLGRRGFNGELAWSTAKDVLAERDDPAGVGREPQGWGPE